LIVELPHSKPREGGENNRLSFSGIMALSNGGKKSQLSSGAEVVQNVSNGSMLPCHHAIRQIEPLSYLFQDV